MATEESASRQPSGNGAFGGLASPAAVLATGIAWIVLLIFFRVFDRADIAFSGLFFDPATCAANVAADGRSCSGFPLALQPALSALRSFLQPLPTMLGMVVLVMALTERYIGRSWREPGMRVKSVLIWTVILGPGLLVNGILKSWWGRPRPWMTEDFGGWLPFVKAGTISTYCDTGNCSFVSGEAASAGWLMCVALLFAVHGYRTLAGLVTAVAVAMAGLRVAFGAHFLSDVVLGFLSTVTVFLTLAAWKEGNLDPAISAMRDRAGRLLERLRGK